MRSCQKVAEQLVESPSRRNLNTLSTPTGRTVNVRIDAHRLTIMHL